MYLRVYKAICLLFNIHFQEILFAENVEKYMHTEHRFTITVPVVEKEMLLGVLIVKGVTHVNMDYWYI